MSTASPTAAATARSSARASASSQPTLSRADAHRRLAAATYVVDGFAVPVTLTLSDGWEFNGFTPHDLVLNRNDAFLALVVMDTVYADPCHPKGKGTAVPPGVDPLVDAFSTMARFRVTDVKQAVVGGARGKSFTLTNDIDLKADRCADEYVVWIGRDGDDAPVLETPQSADAVWVVDATGTTVLIGGPQAAVEGIRFPGATP
jgi:hypothetical protein